MKQGPDIALIASLIGDPARANMLTALLSGQALTATELSQEAGVTAQTGSSHLKRLVEGGLLVQRKQGRHRYFLLANEDVAHLLENLMGVAAQAGHRYIHTGPRNADLRKARICYHHLAGHMGVEMYESFIRRDFLRLAKDGLELSDLGAEFICDFGIDLDGLRRQKSPLCRECLDWSERRSHLAGSLGRALLHHMEQLRWLSRLRDSRVIRFTKKGEIEFGRYFLSA